MTTVRNLLAQKGHDVWSIEPDATVFAALELMAEKKIGAVLVVKNGRPVGILSERDYARKIILLDRSSRKTTVGEIMTPDPVFIRPDQTIEECMALMTARRIRHLPVVENDSAVGLVSIGDVVKAKISHQQFMIQQLENYISSGG
jgi:CBS domain-containing protein